MSREQIEIKVVTYKEERLNYFTALYEKAKNKFDRLFKKHKDAPYLSDEFQKMSDAGHEAEFLGDVVKMLKQSEWISVDERLPEPNEDCLVVAKVGDRVVVDMGKRILCWDYRTGEHYCEWMITNDWDEGEGCEITHWMPLPEPPKGE